MKSTHFMISRATTTLIIHFISFFHFSHSPAATTLNQVTTIIMMARKKANAFIADKITNSTELFHIIASVNHQIPSCQVVN